MVGLPVELSEDGKEIQMPLRRAGNSGEHIGTLFIRVNSDHHEDQNQLAEAFHALSKLDEADKMVIAFALTDEMEALRSLIQAVTMILPTPQELKGRD